MRMPQRMFIVDAEAIGELSTRRGLPPAAPTAPHCCCWRSPSSAFLTYYSIINSFCSATSSCYSCFCALTLSKADATYTVVVAKLQVDGGAAVRRKHAHQRLHVPWLAAIIHSFLTLVGAQMWCSNIAPYGKARAESRCATRSRRVCAVRTGPGCRRGAGAHRGGQSEGQGPFPGAGASPIGRGEQRPASILLLADLN